MTEGKIVVGLGDVPLHRCSQLWYGLEKIGKTTLAAQFPDPLFIMTEPGARFVKVKRLDVANWAGFRKAVREVVQHQRGRWKTVVVDTVDNLYVHCRLFVCKKLGIEHPSEAEYGKAWDLLRHEFFTWIHLLSTVPCGLIFISHAKTVEIRRRGGASFSRTTSTMGRAEDTVKPLVDIYAYYEYNDMGRRVLHVEGDELVSAGHRCVGHFQGVRAIPMGRSPQEAYRNLVAAYENRLETRRRKKKGGTKKVSERR